MERSAGVGGSPAGTGTQAYLVRDESPRRFDVLPLLVATDGAIAQFGRDRRRLRPNIVIGGVLDLEEREWEGGIMRIGDVVIDIHDLRVRCIMTTFDPDTLAHDRPCARHRQALRWNAGAQLRGAAERRDSLE